MFTKLFITAAAAAAVSVPLAGVASADPPSGNNPPGQGATGPGMPHELGAFADSIGLNPNGQGQPIPPGQEINLAKAASPGVSTPVAVGTFINNVYAATGNPNTTFGPTAPGMAVKSFSPGCASGHGPTDPAVNNGGPICH
jgi:hypothetical protein